MLRCYEPAHIVGVSKTAYVPATPRCLQWRRAPQTTSTNNDPADPDSQEPRRRPARRHRGDRRGPRRPVAGVLVLVPDGRIAHRRPSQRAPRCARRGRRCRPRRHDGLRRRDPGCRQPRLRSARCPAPGCDRRRGRRGRVRRRQRLAFPGVPGAPPPRGGLEVRLRSGSRPLGGHPQHVCSRVGGRGRPRARPTPRRGCPSTAPRTGCARSTATSPGTTSCAPKPSSTVALPCTPTPTHDPRMQP